MTKLGFDGLSRPRFIYDIVMRNCILVSKRKFDRERDEMLKGNKKRMIRPFAILPTIIKPQIHSSFRMIANAIRS
jgi:hypothetical protein